VGRERITTSQRLRIFGSYSSALCSRQAIKTVHLHRAGKSHQVEDGVPSYALRVPSFLSLRANVIRFRCSSGIGSRCSLMARAGSTLSIWLIASPYLVSVSPYLVNGPMCGLCQPPIRPAFGGSAGIFHINAQFSYHDINWRISGLGRVRSSREALRPRRSLQA
jgi:hypothetical protein